MTMDLGINIEALMAAPLGPAEVEVVGAMAPADYASIGAGNTGQDYSVKKITERHHALARAIASGLKDDEACAVVGFNKMMLFYLRRSPAFLDLIDMYRNDVNAEYAELHERFAGLTKDAIITLHERLENEPEAFSPRALLEIVKVAGDRAGYAPTTRTEIVTTNVTLAEKLAMARARASAYARDVTPPAPGAPRPLNLETGE